VSLIELRIAAIGLILAALGIAAWQFVSAERKIGAVACETAVAKATAATQAAASATEAQWQEKFDEQQRVANAAIGDIQSKLNAAYARLRVRPPSGGGMPQAADLPASGSGGELPRTIGLDPLQQAQLEYEAARADSLRANLGRCQGEFGAVR